jgi:hypothetical protein
MRPWLIYFAVFVGFVLFAAGMNSDYMKELRDPQNFWNDRVRSRTALVDFYRKDYAQCVSDLKMAFSSAGKRSFALEHLSGGGSPEDLAKAYADDMALRQTICDAWGKSLKAFEDELEQATRKLARSQ